MNWSLRVGRIFGIPVYIHWTFLLILVWAFYAFGGTANFARGITGTVLILLLFACVLLHEFGHALAARRYGIHTDSVTMLPIGGVARLQRMPKEPMQEFVVAIAGPLVNVGIAAVLFVVGNLFLGLRLVLDFELLAKAGGPILQAIQWLLIANVFLVIFNLIPAFPMDGGRVLRAILASQMTYAKATRIAARVGQLCAVLFVFGGIFILHNPFLILIALFVFFGAEAEAQAAEQSATFERVTVNDALMPRFRSVNEADTLALAVNELLAGSQRDFPVMRGDKLVGILNREALIRGLATLGYTGQVRDAMRTAWHSIDVDDALEEVYHQMIVGQESMLPVLRDDKLVGILTIDNIHELLMIRNALRDFGIDRVVIPASLRRAV